MRRATTLGIILALACSVGIRPAFAQEKTTELKTSKPLSRTQHPEAIEKTARYFLDMYGGYLNSRDPLARAMVVISLAGLDDPRSTERIYRVMMTDQTAMVRVYAWEALHARMHTLNTAQLTQWIRMGFDLNTQAMLRGDLRIGLVDALAIAGPTAINKKHFRTLFGMTSARNPGDVRTLMAMGKLLSEWKSPDLVRSLVDALRDHNSAWRADFVLRRMPNPPKPSGSMYREGSVAVWRRTESDWREWIRKNRLVEKRTSRDPRATSALLPAGEKILDAADTKWLKDLELEKFTLKQLDVGFVIDATGSMGSLVSWIQSDILRMMRAFELISREPRIGVTLYRDYGEDFVVKPIPLSARADVLAEALRPIRAKGGGDIPEAVYAALDTTSKAFRWSGGSARKVIVLLGDAPPHEKYLKNIEKLIQADVKRGFVFYAVKIKSGYKSKRPNYDPQLKGFDRIAELGGGKSFWVTFGTLQMEHRNYGVAQPRSAEAPDRIILREILKAAMAKGYEHRVNHFVNVLEQYTEHVGPEKRSVVPPHKPSKKPYKPRPRKDPQG